MKSLKDYILESSSNKIAISFINQDNIEDFMYNAFEDKNSNAYSEAHKGEIEEYLLQQGIPYYVRQAKGYWLVKYDKEADR